MVKVLSKAAVSSLGRFKNTFGVVSTPRPRLSGYTCVQIYKKNYRMNRLIAFAFKLPRKEGQDQVNHKDGDPSNNKLSNLEWTSQSENVQHSYATNTNRKSGAGKQSKPILGRKIGNTDWTRYDSVMDASRQLQLCKRSISNCCNGRQNRTGEYEFKFDVPNEAECLEGEEWEQVEGTNAYVSSLGRFKNTFGVVSTPNPLISGYVRVSIKNKSYSLHRLIAFAFKLPRKEGQTQVNHKDGNPSNNKLSNLEWTSQSENIRHSYATNTNRKSGAGKRSKPILGRKIGNTDWTRYDSVMDASRQLQLKQGSISNCCIGKRKRTGEYEFKFDVPNEEKCLEGEEWRDVDEALLCKLMKFK